MFVVLSTRPSTADTLDLIISADVLLTVFRCRARRYLASKQLMRAVALSSYDGVTVWSVISRYLATTPRYLDTPGYLDI